MTGQLKADLDAIGLQPYLKDIFKVLDEVLDYVNEESNDEISPLDVIDYISMSMQEYLEDRGGLNENENGTNPTEIEIYDKLYSISDDDDEILAFVDAMRKKGVNLEGQSLEDWGVMFGAFVLDKETFLGDDYVSEEDELFERLSRNAGI